MQMSGGHLLPPVQKLVATIIRYLTGSSSKENYIAIFPVYIYNDGTILVCLFLCSDNNA
jgi:hypothetical protein